MVFDGMGKSDASFVHDVKLLISIRSHPLQGISETDNRTKILRAGRGCYLLGSNGHEVLFLLFKRYADI